MATLRLPYVHAYRDRHGRRRYYFRRRGYPRVPLPGDPGSEEFMAAYRTALAGGRLLSAGAAKPGSVAAAVASYLGSVRFLSLKPSTQQARRRILERFREQHGDKPIALLGRQHVERMIAAKSATPAAAQVFLKVLRSLLRHAVEIGMCQTNPAIGVGTFRQRSEGIHSWTEEEIAIFERAYVLGTRERLAFDLLLYTAQRRSDVVRMGPQHARNGVLYVRQQKTGAELEIPVHPRLAASLAAAAPSGHLTFLATAFGKPFTSAGFGNWFREACNAAGLPKCSAHGLRKAALRRLAEAGCSANQIQAISGHQSLAEVQRYVRAADQARLAKAAMAAITPESETGTPDKDGTEVANLSG